MDGRHNWQKLRLLYRAIRLKYRKRIFLALQRIEDDIYDVNIRAEPWLKYLTSFLVLVAFASVCISTGFQLNDRHQYWAELLDIILLHGFILSFLIRFILNADRMEFIRHRWFEAVLTVFALFIAVQMWFNAFSLALPFLHFLGSRHPKQLVTGIIKGYLVLLVIIKTIQGLPSVLDVQRNTGRLLIVSFMGLILFGALLLMMPNMTTDQHGLSFINALFTSTSAVCVTGLIVVDTATKFTMMGQTVIMILIQLGGIGIVTFATFFALFLSRGLGVGQMTFLRDMLQEENVNEISGTLYRIIGLTLFIEFLGAISFYISWSHLIPDSGDRLFFSVFHAVSAFCNAGFALFSNGFADKANALNIGVNLTTMLLIIFGGLGFTTIWEIVSDAKNRLTKHHRLSVHSRMVVVTTAILIVGGAFLILVSEWNGTLSGYTFGQKTMLAFFQSVTPRTAGFNTLNIGALATPTAIIIMILMFIGASPASTGGGIKTTTAAVLFMSVMATIRGHNRIEIGKKMIPMDIVMEALTAMLLGATLIFISAFLLSITEHFHFMDLLFEEISAFGTVGLSRGITSGLTDWGKSILIISMYTGRVGSVTLAVAFASKIEKRHYLYPTESVMVS